MKTNIPVWVAVSILVVSVISGVLTIGANYVTIREYLEKKKATTTPNA